MGSFLGISSVNCFAWTTSYKGFFAKAFSVLSLARLFPRALFRNGGIHGLIPRSFFHAILCIDFLRALFRRGFFRAVFCSFVLSHTPWQRMFPWAEPRGPNLCASLQGHFPCTLLNRRFPRTLSRGFLRALLRGAVSLGTLSQRRFPRSAFCSLPCNVFLRVLFRRDFFLALFCKAIFVHFCAETFSMHSSQGCLPCAFVRGFIPQPSFRNLFRHDLPRRFSLEPFPWGISRAFFCMDSFHGIFRGVVFSALSRGILFGALFSGPSPWSFLRGRTPWALLLGPF